MEALYVTHDIWFLKFCFIFSKFCLINIGSDLPLISLIFKQSLMISYLNVHYWSLILEIIFNNYSFNRLTLTFTKLWWMYKLKIESITINKIKFWDLRSVLIWKKILIIFFCDTVKPLHGITWIGAKSAKFLRITLTSHNSVYSSSIFKKKVFCFVLFSKKCYCNSFLICPKVWWTC